MLSERIHSLSDAPQVDVVLLEPDPDLCRLATRILDGTGHSSASVSTLAQARLAISRLHPKAILCDEQAFSNGGPEFVQFLRAQPELAGTHCILMGAGTGAQAAAVAGAARADDYLSKSGLREELPVRLRVGLRIQSMHDSLCQAVITDRLTGLANHDRFHRILTTEFERSRRYTRNLALIVFDLDRFQALNDTHGHPAGDEVLVRVAHVVRERIRTGDSAGRIGGDGFAVLLPECRAGDAHQLAERLKEAIAAPTAVGGVYRHETTASFGVSDNEHAMATSGDQLMDRATQALAQAKREGGNRVRLADRLGAREGMDVAIEHEDIGQLQRQLVVLGSRIRDMYVQSVATLLTALDEKDPYAARHSVNVAFYSEQIARELQSGDATCKCVYNAALLHDIGKVGVPDAILMKRNPLTPMEQMVIDQVPLIGTRIVDHMRILDPEIQIIRHQREFFDGTGTPSGLAGDQIPLGARILMAADAFDAMTTDRIYRARRPVEAALAEINRCTGTQFDPAVGGALQRLFLRNRPAWEARIRDTIIAARVPTEDGLATAANGFGPSRS